MIYPHLPPDTGLKFRLVALLGTLIAIAGLILLAIPIAIFDLVTQIQIWKMRGAK